MAANVQTCKAYKNSKFLASEGARNIRILCECTETQQRLGEHGITATILFFGSARAKSTVDHGIAIADIEKKIAALNEANSTDGLTALENRLKSLQNMQWMCEYYDKVSELSKKITEWSMSGVRLGKCHRVTGVTRANPSQAFDSIFNKVSQNGVPANENTPSIDEDMDEDDETDSRCVRQAIVVACGGGPGFMEAASLGASQVPGSQNIGMGISLPFEKGLNPYVTPELAFEYHYFFTRKLWMMFYCQALVVAPGGLGTLDELFEVLTLRQTGKISKDLPVVLIGKNFWESVINWKALVNAAVLNEADIADIFITDDVDTALHYLTDRLTFQAPVTKLPNSSSMNSFINK